MIGADFSAIDAFGLQGNGKFARSLRRQIYCELKPDCERSKR